MNCASFLTRIKNYFEANYVKGNDDKNILKSLKDFVLKNSLYSASVS